MILLRPKMHSLQYLGNYGGIKRAKSTLHHIAASISHDTCSDTSLSRRETIYDTTILLSQLHTGITVIFRKRSLSVFENKHC